MVEAAAEHGVLQREQEGGAFEGLGELLAHSSGHFRRGEDRDTGAAEEVIVCFQTAGRRDGGVRQDEVKAVELEAERFLLAALEALAPPSSGPARPLLTAMVAAARVWSPITPRAG